MGCNNGIAELEKRNSFYESVVKIGQGFQEIFGIFGNAIGFTSLKSDDQRSKVGKHFEKIGEGLKATNDKLKGLSSKISEARNVDESTIKVVEEAIKGAGDVFEQLIGVLTKLAGATNAGVEIGYNNGTSAAVGADKDDVKAIIESVKKIIEVADKSGVKFEDRNDGSEVAHGSAQTNAPAALGGTLLSLVQLQN